jgi:hypothetical protein
MIQPLLYALNMSCNTGVLVNFRLYCTPQIFKLEWCPARPPIAVLLQLQLCGNTAQTPRIVNKLILHIWGQCGGIDNLR